MGRPHRIPTSPPPQTPPGPMRAHMVQDGDPIELCNGHVVQRMPAGGRHGAKNIYAGQIFASDPISPGAAIDLGISTDDLNLRAPDAAITPHTDVEGWVHEVPPVAVEYAGRYQDEASLQEKIRSFLAGGMEHLWVVRLGAHPYVEVHSPDRPVWVARAGALLEAPGWLQNPIPAEALWDRDAAHHHTLRNLLQRQGYDDLDAVIARGEAIGRAQGEAIGRAQGEAIGRAQGEAIGRAQGEAIGRAQGEAIGRAQGQAAGLAHALLVLLEARGLSPSVGQRAAILDAQDPATLTRWVSRAASAASVAAVLAD